MLDILCLSLFYANTAGTTALARRQCPVGLDFSVNLLYLGFLNASTSRLLHRSEVEEKESY